MIKNFFRSVFRSLRGLQAWAEEGTKNETPMRKEHTQTNNQITITSEVPIEKKYRIINLWDYLVFNENTQANHITKKLNYEEWNTMEEILRRVKELFVIEYLNDRSLYPYIKTLVDTGLLEVNMSGGKMRWKKKGLLVSIIDEVENEALVAPHSNPLQ